MQDVLLSWEEYLEAVAVGDERQDAAEREGWRDDYDNAGSNDAAVHRQQHIDGAVAERAFAKWSGLPWTGKDITTFAGADVGMNVQVKFRPNPAQPDLSVRAKDNSEHIYVLAHRPVKGDPLLVRFVGWIRGSMAKRVGLAVTSKAGRVVYYVKPPMLNPMPEHGKASRWRRVCDERAE